MIGEIVKHSSTTVPLLFFIYMPVKMLLPNFIESDQLMGFTGCTMSFSNVPFINLNLCRRS